jgi:hypothetical protein
MNYNNKYLKYKKKYLDFKYSLYGGAPELQIQQRIKLYSTLGPLYKNYIEDFFSLGTFINNFYKVYTNMDSTNALLQSIKDYQIDSTTKFDLDLTKIVVPQRKDDKPDYYIILVYLNLNIYCIDLTEYIYKISFNVNDIYSLLSYSKVLHDNIKKLKNPKHQPRVDISKFSDLEIEDQQIILKRLNSTELTNFNLNKTLIHYDSDLVSFEENLKYKTLGFTYNILFNLSLCDILSILDRKDPTIKDLTEIEKRKKEKCEQIESNWSKILQTPIMEGLKPYSELDFDYKSCIINFLLTNLVDNCYKVYYNDNDNDNDKDISDKALLMSIKNYKITENDSFNLNLTNTLFECMKHALYPFYIILVYLNNKIYCIDSQCIYEISFSNDNIYSLLSYDDQLHTNVKILKKHQLTDTDTDTDTNKKFFSNLKPIDQNKIIKSLNRNYLEFFDSQKIMIYDEEKFHVTFDNTNKYLKYTDNNNNIIKIVFDLSLCDILSILRKKDPTIKDPTIKDPTMKELTQIERFQKINGKFLNIKLIIILYKFYIILFNYVVFPNLFLHLVY